MLVSRQTQTSAKTQHCSTPAFFFWFGLSASPLTYSLCTPLLLFLLFTVAINPNGRSYASGAEDGYVRLHFFDKSYLDMKDPVPEAEESTDDDADNANAE